MDMAGGIIGGIADFWGIDQSSTAEHEAALENVKYYRQGAVDEGVAALDQQAIRRTQLREALGQQVVDVAKSGVSFTGSVILALGESMERAERDALALKRQGDKRVDEFLRAATGEVNRARNIRRGVGPKALGALGNMLGGMSKSKQPSGGGKTDNPNTTNSGGDVTNNEDYHWGDL